MATRHGRERKGSVKKRYLRDANGQYILDKKGRRRVKAWFARVTFVGRDGSRKDRMQVAESESDAREKVTGMLADVRDDGETALDDRDRTFGDLCDYFEKHYLTAAEYNELGLKEAGLRSLNSAQSFFKTLKAHFAAYRLQEIAIEDVRAFRKQRRATPTRGDKARHREAAGIPMQNKKGETIEINCTPGKCRHTPRIVSTRTTASVNRELSLLRRMLNVALDKGWIKKNPIVATKGRDTLISTAGEKRRERILTISEEQRLLKACAERYVRDEQGKYVLTNKGEKRIKAAGRGDLQSVVICALDTGMRRGEILKLVWHDIDLDNRMITVKAFNTKTAKARQVAITTRLATTLTKLWEESDRDPDARVFGVDDVKRSFDSARAEADLKDVRFHDLRHTVASRLVSRQVPLPEVGRLLGHSLPSTTYRYVNPNEDTLRRAADVLESFSEPTGPTASTAFDTESVN